MRFIRLIVLVLIVSSFSSSVFATGENEKALQASSSVTVDELSVNFKESNIGALMELDLSNKATGTLVMDISLKSKDGTLSSAPFNVLSKMYEPIVNPTFNEFLETAFDNRKLIKYTETTDYYGQENLKKLRYVTYIDEIPENGIVFLNSITSLYQITEKYNIDIYYYANTNLLHYDGKTLKELHLGEVPRLATPNFKLHDFPIGRATLKKDVAMYKFDPKSGYIKYKTLKKGENIRVYGFNEEYMNVGGAYFIKNDNNISYYEGRVNIDTDTPLYKPDGKVHRMLKKNEAIRVYNISSDKYDVGGGYYIKKDNKVTYFKGFFTTSHGELSNFQDPNGKRIIMKVTDIKKVISLHAPAEFSYYELTFTDGKKFITKNPYQNINERYAKN